MRTSFAFGLTVVAVTLSTEARAQSPGGEKWAPWVGCWALVAENERDGGGVAPSRDEGESLLPTVDARPRVCVALAGDGGATFTTTVRGQTVFTLTLVPDATDRPLADGECRGTHRAEWSRSGQRLFSGAALTCPGAAAPRRVSGLALITPNGSWLDVQSVSAGSQESVRVRRYRRIIADTNARAPAGGRVGTRLTLDDIKEASAKVSATALEAALVETNAGFDLTGKDLVDLAEAGVAPRVIDLTIALSYPERFAVDRTPRESDSAPALDPYFLGWAFGYPPWWDYPGGFAHAYYDVYWPYYGSPFGYAYIDRYGPTGLGGYGGFATGEPGGAGSQPARPSGAGRVVDGRGYTQVRPRGTASTESGGSDAPSGQGVRSRVVNTRSDSSAPSGSASSGSSSSGGATSGQSSGSSGGDTGRTAQPR